MTLGPLALLRDLQAVRAVARDRAEYVGDNLPALEVEEAEILQALSADAAEHLARTSVRRWWRPRHARYVRGYARSDGFAARAIADTGWQTSVIESWEALHRIARALAADPRTGSHAGRSGSMSVTATIQWLNQRMAESMARDRFAALPQWCEERPR